MELVVRHRGTVWQGGADQRLSELGYALPESPAPGGNYLSAKTVGSLVFLAGVVSIDERGVMTGVVGGDRTIEEGYAAARQCAPDAACRAKANSRFARPDQADRLRQWLCQYCLRIRRLS